MKTTKIKTGTKEEIVKYMRSKVKKTIMDVTNAAKSFGETGEKYSPWDFKEGELAELESNTIEKQIDEFIKSGNPVIVVSLAGSCGCGTYRERFLMTDFSNLQTDMLLERLDNLEMRNDYMERIKMIMDMELKAEERWERILKIIDEFKGVTIPIGDL